jgi:hypothetical protein
VVDVAITTNQGIERISGNAGDDGLDIEVDQSGKIEDTRVDTVIAFSNGLSGTILIPAVVKRVCIRALRKQDWRK